MVLSYVTEKQCKKLHEELLKSERFDMYVTDNVYTLKKRLFSCKNTLRIIIDENIPLYAYADAWDAIHSDMRKLLIENGYEVGKFYEKGRTDLICVPNNDEEFDIEADAVDDYYFEGYEYDTFTIYSREYSDNCGIAFTDTSLYKVLGEPNKVWDLSEYYDDEPLDESLLLEATRNELIMKSKKGDAYKDQSKGKNRFERRTKSKISRYVKQYNDIDMNNFFKNDILTVGIDVNGETNNYVVKMKFSGVLKAIQDMIKANNNTLDFRTIFVSLANTFKSGDVYMHCTCPDWKFRFDYWSTVNKYNAGQPQNDPGKGIANPRDSKGGGCKHTLLVLNNLDWLMKIASVINNYIHYAEHNMKRPFENLIFPKLYGVPFNQAVKADIIPDEDLDSSKSIIDIINEYGRTRTQYKKQPEKSVNPRFHQNKKEVKVDNT